MLTLVSGGAASGKSEYAEFLTVSHPAQRRIYLATMEAWGEEGRTRVARHQALRRGKGFETIEAPRNLSDVTVPSGSVVLLECLSNLCANECFGPEGFHRATERILSGIETLEGQAAEVLVVTNELFSDGISYPKETAEYLRILSQLNQILAAKAQRVAEVVCGIPVWQKGAER